MQERAELRPQTPLINAWRIIGIWVLPYMAVCVCSLFNINDNESIIRMIMRLYIGIAAASALYFRYKKQLDENNALRLVMMLGLILRMGYMLYTNWHVRYYDVGELGMDDLGHGAYIVSNIVYGRLPQNNYYQFYHPPLYHMVSGLAVKIAALIRGTDDYASLIKYAAATACAASCVSVVMVQRLADALKIKRKHQIAAMALTAVYPNMILMGGRVNNDAFVTLFMILSVYFTVRWYYETEMKHIIGIALSMGLGMMSKISCGTLAVVIAPVMLYKLYRAWREKEPVPIIKQLAVFALICFPLGLWYPIRNYIRFGQPLSYVTPLGEDAKVYTGNVEWYKRFLSIPIWEIFKTPYMDSGRDYSIFMIMTRTAVFGEFQYENVAKLVSVGLYFVNLALMLYSLAAMAAVCVRDRVNDKFRAWGMAALWAAVMASQLMFNVSMPYSCTADIRYIPLAFVSGCMYFAMWSEGCASKKRGIKNPDTVLKALTVLYAAAVIIMYA